MSAAGTEPARANRIFQLNWAPPPGSFCGTTLLDWHHCSWIPPARQLQIAWDLWLYFWLQLSLLTPSVPQETCCNAGEG